MTPALIDVVLALDKSDRPSFFRALSAQGFEVPQPYVDGWTDRVSGLPVAKVKIDVAGRGVDVDLFFVESSFQQSLMARRLCIEVDGRTLWIAAAEDLVLLKPLASRPRDRLGLRTQLEQVLHEANEA